MKYVLALVCLVVSLAGCKTTTPAGGKTDSKTWVVTLMDKQANPVTADGSKLTLKLNDDHVVTGFDGCNEFTGKFKTEKNTITFSDFLSTQRACPDNKLSALYMDLLTRSNGYSITQSKLILFINKKAVLEFGAQN
ncbi:MAG: META domain-containing protein [Bacteroidia bacterium]|jgi:heat shock protein HslJ|nr:META domain-containing protein [Bacteroidia bacterium]